MQEEDVKIFLRVVKYLRIYDRIGVRTAFEQLVGTGSLRNAAHICMQNRE